MVILDYYYYHYYFFFVCGIELIKFSLFSVGVTTSFAIIVVMKNVVSETFADLHKPNTLKTVHINTYLNIHGGTSHREIGRAHV